MGIENSAPESLGYLVDGMKCGQCLWKVETSLKKIPEVQSVAVDLTNKTVFLNVKSSSLRLEQEIEENILHLGFKPQKMEGLDEYQSQMKKQNLKLLLRLGIAGACAGNIMLIAVSMYSGADQSSFSSYFGWLTFLLFIPILGFSAQPFFEGAWQGWKARKITIDLPMALVLVAGTGLSLFHLIKGEGDTYFDSLGALVFLLLVSRYLVQRLQQRVLKPDLLEPFLKVKKVEVFREETWQNLPLKELKTGDRIRVIQNAMMPVDGCLLSRTPVYINASLFSGESYPQKILPFQEVLAGTSLLSDSAEVQVEKLQSDTRIGQLFAEMKSQLRTRTPLLSQMDRWAQKFTLVVLTTALVFFVVYVFVDLQEALQRSLALIILACPCALAFGVPLTQSFSMLQAIQKGIVFKKAETLEKLQNICSVFFDKTGTLTRGEFRLLKTFPEKLSPEVQSLVLSLEKKSQHPIGKALAHYFQSAEPLELENWEEAPGRGVRAHYKGKLFEICAHTSQATQTFVTEVALKCEGQILARLQLGDEPREDSKALLQNLRKTHACYLLTGDQQAPALAMGQELGFEPDHILYQVTPEEKRNTLKSHEHSMMVGDGVNDAPAMAASEIAVAMHGSMEASLHAADIYLTNAGASQIQELFEISRKSQKTTFKLLNFSIAYNLLGGSLALLGWVTPLLAAVLMPMSSFLVVLLAWRGTR